MTDICPRFSPGPWKFTGECEWGRLPDRTCRYCGSMNPDDFMSRLESGTVRLGATNKSYKVYVSNAGGEPMRQTFRDCPRDATCTPDDCAHWKTCETHQQKFYFEHLSHEQRARFVELLNDRRLKFEDGESFYVLPFFMEYRRA